MLFLREKFLDPYHAGSLAWQLRRKRFTIFKQWLDQFPRPLNILDVGGTPHFWQSMNFENPHDIHITLLNLEAYPVHSSMFTSLAGDATDLYRFKNDEFDIVFSNSVIEHVGDDWQQWKMAHEIARVGKAYFVQTPNILFPIEAHFYFPFFQFMPLHARAFVLYYFDLTGGGIQRTIQAWKTRLCFQKFQRGPQESWERCMERVKSVRLLGKAKFRKLFPDGLLYKEKSFGLTKSYILYTNPQGSVAQ
jgi:hypothetical protein